MKPRFSIIVPTLGRLPLWKQALESVVAQDFKDFELIAIDSHPTQASAAIITAIDDPRIRYIPTSPAESRLNWDVGYRNSEGEYILWLDDDNYLLPHALSALATTVEQHRPDIVTGDHIHWYDAHHPIPTLRNRIAVPSRGFSHAAKQIEGANYIRSLFGMPTGPLMRPRFHFSETAIQRLYFDRIIATTGPIDFTKASPRLFQLLLLASTHSVWFVETPIAIIIQMGDSMAYTWSQRRAREKRFASHYAHSPVSADTYINYVTENLLRAKEMSPRALAPFEVNWDRFFRTHAKELALVDTGWRQFVQSWIELAVSLRKLNRSDTSVIVFIAPWIAVAFAIKVLRDIRLYPMLRAVFSCTRVSAKKAKIVAVASYGIHSISDCAARLPQIVEKELGTTYAEFSGAVIPAQVQTIGASEARS